MKWININEKEPESGAFYLIYEDGYILATYIINGEFLDTEGERYYPDFYCELEEPKK